MSTKSYVLKIILLFFVHVTQNQSVSPSIADDIATFGSTNMDTVIFDSTTGISSASELNSNDVTTSELIASSLLVTSPPFSTHDSTTMLIIVTGDETQDSAAVVVSTTDSSFLRYFYSRYINNFYLCYLNNAVFTYQ